MEYFRLRPTEALESGTAPEPAVPAENRVGDLVYVLLHDMADNRTLTLGELPVRRRMEDLEVTLDDCDTLGGNLATIAMQGPKTAEDREILCFYFALGLKGRLHVAQGPKRQRALMNLRETLDFLSGVFGPRVLANVEILEPTERQQLWDLLGSTVLSLGREQRVPGVDLAGALMRWTGLLALAPREDRLLIARALVSAGAPPSGRLVLVGLLDPVADAELLARAILTAGALAPSPQLGAMAPGPHLEAGAPVAPSGPDTGERPRATDDVAWPEHNPFLAAEQTEVRALEDQVSAALIAAAEEELADPRDTAEMKAAESIMYEVSGRAVPVRSPGRRLVARLTGWALAERLTSACAAVFLGVRREGHLRLTRAGLVYDETLWLLGRAVRERTIGVPIESMAARLDRRHNFGTLITGLVAAVVGAFLATLWFLDGLRTGYGPLIALAGGVLCLGLVVDLLLFRFTGRLRGQAQLVLDGGEGTRIRLDGVRRAEAEALLAALAGPSRFQSDAKTGPPSA